MTKFSFKTTEDFERVFDVDEWRDNIHYGDRKATSRKKLFELLNRLKFKDDVVEFFYQHNVLPYNLTLQWIPAPKYNHDCDYNDHDPQFECMLTFDNPQVAVLFRFKFL